MSHNLTLATKTELHPRLWLTSIVSHAYIARSCMINNLTVKCLKILGSLPCQVVVELLTTEFFSWIQLLWWPLKRVPCWWEAKLPFSRTWTCFPCSWEAKLPFSQTWTCFPCWWEGKLQFNNSVRLEACFPMPNWKKAGCHKTVPCWWETKLQCSQTWTCFPMPNENRQDVSNRAMLMRNQTSMQSDLNMFPNAKWK